jgi:hypothetical protein
MVTRVRLGVRDNLRMTESIRCHDQCDVACYAAHLSGCQLLDLLDSKHP